MADTSKTTSDPSKTYTLSDFVGLKITDETTYFNFSIIEKYGNIIFTDHNLLDEYVTELKNICITVGLTPEELKKYRYSPDLLAYDIYGSVQLDFVILLANDMIDPKEFNIKNIKLPYNSALKQLLSEVYRANSGYISQNRVDNGINVY